MIANITGKSVSAIYSMQQRIRDRLGVKTSNQAVTKAIREDLI